MELLIVKKRPKLNITFLTQKYYWGEPVLHFCYLKYKQKIKSSNTVGVYCLHIRKGGWIGN